jgi:hypothetical protein
MTQTDAAKIESDSLGHAIELNEWRFAMQAE